MIFSQFIKYWNSRVLWQYPLSHSDKKTLYIFFSLQHAYDSRKPIGVTIRAMYRMGRKLATAYNTTRDASACCKDRGPFLSPKLLSPVGKRAEGHACIHVHATDMSRSARSSRLKVQWLWSPARRYRRSFIATRYNDSALPRPGNHSWSLHFRSLETTTGLSNNVPWNNAELWYKTFLNILREN